jgi:hypothetical protein
MENIDRKELVDLFKTMVNIYSPPKHEKAMGEFVIKFMRELGAEIYCDRANEKFGGDCPNIFCKIPGTIEGEGVTISVHMDVVEPNKGVKIVEEGDIIKSDGTTTLGGDDKGGIAVLLYSLKYLLKKGYDHEPIWVIFTPGEEIGLLGSRNVDWPEVYKHIQPSKKVIVLDIGGPSKYVAYKAPTSTNYRLIAHGKASHGGTAPEKGINAILILAETILQYKTARIDEETTGNISIFKAEGPTNVVQDYAEAYGEMRSHSEEKIKKYLDEYEEIGKKTAAKYGGSFEMIREWQYPKLDSPDNCAFAKEFIGVYKKLGIDAELLVMGGCFDANFFAREGFNSIMISVGMNTTHTLDEYIDVRDMMTACQALLAYWKK